VNRASLSCLATRRTRADADARWDAGPTGQGHAAGSSCAVVNAARGATCTAQKPHQRIAGNRPISTTQAGRQPPDGLRKSAGRSERGASLRLGKPDHLPNHRRFQRHESSGFTGDCRSGQRINNPYVGGSSPSRASPTWQGITCIWLVWVSRRRSLLPDTRRGCPRVRTARFGRVPGGAVGPVFGGMSATPQDGIGIRGKHRRSLHAGLWVHLNGIQGAAVESKG
jgi:hypothetical protein